MFIKGGGPFKRRKIPYKKNYKASLNRRIKSIISKVAERKENDNVFSGNLIALSLTQNTFVGSLNSIAEGSDSNQRIGRSINLASVEMDISLLSNNVSWDGFYAIVLDRQPNSSLPSFSDIFDVSTLGFVNVGIALRNTLSYQDRFVVLKRGEINLNTSVNTQTHDKVFVDLGRLKGMDRTANYSGSGAVVPNNAAVLVTIAGSTNAALSTSFLANCKLRFTDM